jgi:hypothetical protein
MGRIQNIRNEKPDPTPRSRSRRVSGLSLALHRPATLSLTPARLGYPAKAHLDRAGFAKVCPIRESAPAVGSFQRGQPRTANPSPRACHASSRRFVPCSTIEKDLIGSVPRSSFV